MIVFSSTLIGAATFSSMGGLYLNHLSFMDTDAFCDFSTKYGLDFEVVASFCESFATNFDLPKEKWFEHHPPIKVKVVAPITVEEKTITYSDPIVPTAYVERPPFSH